MPTFDFINVLNKAKGLVINVICNPFTIIASSVVLLTAAFGAILSYLLSSFDILSVFTQGEFSPIVNLATGNALFDNFAYALALDEIIAHIVSWSYWLAGGIVVISSFFVSLGVVAIVLRCSETVRSFLQGLG